MKKIYIMWILSWAVLLEGFAQKEEKVQLPSTEVTVQQVIDLIEGQTPYRFSYDPSKLPMKEQIKYPATEVTVEEALKKLADEKPLVIKSHEGLITIKPTVTKKTVNIYGYVLDVQTRENLLSATVINKTSGKGTLANNYGYYKIEAIPNESIVLQASYVGFESLQMEVLPTSDTLINLPLRPLVLSEVVVEASNTEPMHEHILMSAIDVPLAQIKSAPALAGETDPVKVLQLLPGVQGGMEGSSGLYVRGGTPDQNLILLDGVPVYNASHLFGFFSVFNSDAINHVELIKGGFPARYGGRLSSVLDIRMKEGNQQHFRGQGALGLITSHITLEGPIRTDRSSYIFSARRTYFDALVKPLRGLVNTEIPFYHFYDLNAKLNHKFSAHDRVFFSVYAGNDEFDNKKVMPIVVQNEVYDNEYVSLLKWGNITSTARWNHVFGPRLFANTTATYSRYRFRIHNDDTQFSFKEEKVVKEEAYNRYYSGIQDWGLRYDLDFRLSDTHSLMAGANSIRHVFSPGAYTTKSYDEADSLLGQSNVTALESDLYIEDNITLNNRLAVNAGLHYSLFNVRNQTYHSMQPRTSIRFLVADKLSVKASYAQMMQFMHLLTNSGVGLPTDLWVPATDRIKPQKSWQAAAGMAYEFQKDVSFSAEAYYKEMEDIIEFKDGAGFLDPVNGWEEKVAAGSGRGYGVELMLHKKQGKLNGWVGYTLAWSDRQFKDINFGERFPFKYDIRNDLSATGSYQVSGRFSVGGTFVFRTGTATTLPTAVYIVDGEGGSRIPVAHYGGRNQYRLPAYHRMDVNATWRKKKRWGERAWVVSVYNVYNRKNPFFIFSSGGASESNTNGLYYEADRHFTQSTLFPIIPSVSYQFNF